MSNRVSNSSRNTNTPKGSWLLAQALFEAGDEGFVDEICRVDDAAKLAAFAKTWFSDHREVARSLLAKYLELPIEHYHHEGMVKRLFKLAEAEGDDEVMGWFMVALDRVVRREVVTSRHYDWQTGDDWTEQRVRVLPNTTMSRVQNYKTTQETDWMSAAQRARLRKWRTNLRLFSVATRNYLRRRVWRYYRDIGKSDPSRYVQSVSNALTGYQDQDCRDGLALIDNWSLIHVLFHDTDVLHAPANGWRLVEGKSLNELQPAPAFIDAWLDSPETLVELISSCRARPIRQWALKMLNEHCPDSLDSVPIDTLCLWLASTDIELAEFAAERLGQSQSVSTLDGARWLELFATSNEDVLVKLCEIANKHLNANSLSVDDQLQLAMVHQAPVVNMAFGWLQERGLSDEQRQKSLQLTDAKCDALRKNLLSWMVLMLRQSDGDQHALLLELLDARQQDVRAAGWSWFLDDSALRGDIKLWQQLMESPYDDVRLGLVDELRRHEATPKKTADLIVRSSQLDATLLRSIWTTVLLGTKRGGKQKPAVIQAIACRLQRNPSEADTLLPILAIAIRSVRRPEFRAALAAVVQLVESDEDLAGQVKVFFPELVVSS